jgi:DNA-binding NarL/FixJ family response regulator
MINSIENSEYLQAVRFAKFYMKKFHTGSIGGKDAHDFAIDSLLEGKFRKIVIKRRIIDAIRREWGDRRRANGHRKPVSLPLDLRTNDQVSSFVQCEELCRYLKGAGLDVREIFIAQGLMDGKMQRDIADMMSISPTRVSQLIKIIAKKMVKHYGSSESSTISQLKLVNIFNKGESK